MFSKLILLAPLLFAAAPQLTSGPPPIKMGLWEATVSNSMSPKALKTRSCMTQQSYQDALAHVPPGCAITNKTQTSTSMTGDVSCTMHGETTTGHIDVRMPDASTVRSTITLTINANGQSMPVTMTADSHFVSADCGDIAPGQSKVIQ